MWTGAQSGLCVIKENCPLSQSRVRALTVITVETNNFPSLLRRFAQTRDNPGPIVTPGVPGSALISWGSLPGELSPAARASLGKSEACIKELWTNERPVLSVLSPGLVWTFWHWVEPWHRDNGDCSLVSDQMGLKTSTNQNTTWRLSTNQTPLTQDK